MNYIGYRWWKASRDDQGALHLRSLVWAWDWNLDGITKAIHYAGGQGNYGSDHRAPVTTCQCGIHAWRTLQAALVGDWGQGHARMYHPTEDGQCLISGAVVTGGLVCLHGDEGLRAQQARPVAFAVEDRRSTHPLVRALATRFGVPVFTYDNLERYAHEFGDRQPVA